MTPYGVIRQRWVKFHAKYSHPQTENHLISRRCPEECICKFYHLHDDIIKWKHFPHYGPFVRGIHRWQRPVTRSFDVFFDLRLNKPLNKQWWGWWFETLSRPLWRHCNDVTSHKHWITGLQVLFNGNSPGHCLCLKNLGGRLSIKTPSCQ